MVALRHMMLGVNISVAWGRLKSSSTSLCALTLPWYNDKRWCITHKVWKLMCVWDFIIFSSNFVNLPQTNQKNTTTPTAAVRITLKFLHIHPSFLKPSCTSSAQRADKTQDWDRRCHRTGHTLPHSHGVGYPNLFTQNCWLGSAKLSHLCIEQKARASSVHKPLRGIWVTEMKLENLHTST